MNLIVGSDHAGFTLKSEVAKHLESYGHVVTVVGAESLDSYNYPSAANAVACAILEKKADFGVLICGSGVGVTIRANRFQGIRAVNCYSKEIAKLSRQHNQANVICLGARIVSLETSLECIETFLETESDPSPRHNERVQMLDANTSC